MNLIQSLMKLISFDKFNDEHWREYANLLNEINRKHYPDESEDDILWETRKSEVLNLTELLKADLAMHYLLVNDEKAAGWYARRLIGGDAYFNFDILNEEATDEALVTIFDNLHEFLKFAGKEIAFTDTCNRRICDALIKYGAEEIDKMIYSKLGRDKIDRNLLEKIIDEVNRNNKLKPEFFDDVNEDLFDRYYEVYNEARIAMNAFNPHRKKVTKRTKENLRTKLKFDKGPEDKMFMYMLFDGDAIAAFSSFYVRKENPKVIDHSGGLTAVSGKYRGNGYAKFLKAKLYIKILDEYPDFDYIRTDTYPWNKYMYKINEEMGFKPFKEFTEFRISKYKLKLNS